MLNKNLLRKICCKGFGILAQIKAKKMLKTLFFFGKTYAMVHFLYQFAQIKDLILLTCNKIKNKAIVRKNICKAHVFLEVYLDHHKTKKNFTQF